MNMTIAEKIRERREELGLSQKELAESVGLTSASIYNIERGNSFNMQSLEKICSALRMRLALVTEDDGDGDVFMVSADELEYDVRKCVKQLDKVKQTLEDLVKTN